MKRAGNVAKIDKAINAKSGWQPSTAATATEAEAAAVGEEESKKKKKKQQQ